MLSLRQILWIVCVLSVTQAQCPVGLFGTNCQYLCHCAGGCLDNGACIGGSTCNRGWFGHMCQTEDVAYEAQVKSGNQVLYWLTDNNDSSCNDDSTLNSVTLRFNSSHPIPLLRMTFKSPDLGSHLHITLVDQWNTYFICGSSYHQVDTHTLDIGCVWPKQTAIQINLSGPDVGQLCSFYVSGGCGSGFFGSDCGQKCEDHCNGETNCDPVNGGCVYPNTPIITTKDSPEQATIQGTTIEGFPQQESSDTTGIIIGCVVGIGSGIVIFIVILIFVMRQRRLREMNRANPEIRMKTVRKRLDREKDLKIRGYRRVTFLKNTSIDVSKLENYLKTHGEEYLRKQFKKDPTPVNVTTHEAQRRENLPKNNFPDILPFDISRVHLNIDDASNEFDYINASYVWGISKDVQFIASQSPNENTIDDFIRMIMEQNITTTVMLNDLQELKCKKYWPENGCLRFGSVQTKLLSEVVYPDYVMRNIELHNTVEQYSLLVKQFHYTAWTSKSIPWTTWSFVGFLCKIASHHSSGPLLVHCRDGAGRTGLFIALFDIIRQAEVKGCVDFFKTFIILRQNRMNMIQNSDQYIFLHHAAYLAVVCLLMEKKGSLKLDQEFKQVSDLCNFLYEKRNSECEDIAENSYSIYNEIEDDSNADPKECFILRNFTNQACKILLPHPKSSSDFWTLAVKHNISVVIAFQLNELYCNETVAKYLPSNTQDSLQCPPFDVKCTNISSGPQWDQHTLTISNLEDKTVRHFKCNFVDFDMRNLFAVLQHSSAADSGATLFMCKNGVKYCGIACLVSLMLSSLANDSFVSIPLLVTSLKALNPDIISTCDEYKLVNEMLRECRVMSASSNEYDKPEGKSEDTSDYTKCDEYNKPEDTSEETSDYTKCDEYDKPDGNSEETSDYTKFDEYN